MSYDLHLQRRALLHDCTAAVPRVLVDGVLFAVSDTSATAGWMMAERFWTWSHIFPRLKQSTCGIGLIFNCSWMLCTAPKRAQSCTVGRCGVCNSWFCASSMGLNGGSTWVVLTLEVKYWAHVYKMLSERTKLSMHFWSGPAFHTGNARLPYRTLPRSGRSYVDQQMTLERRMRKCTTNLEVNASYLRSWCPRDTSTSWLEKLKDTAANCEQRRPCNYPPPNQNSWK